MSEQTRETESVAPQVMGRTVYLTPKQVRQLAHDATICAGAAKIWAPMSQKRVQAAAARILKLLAWRTVKKRTMSR